MIGQAIIFQRIDLGFEPALIGAVASAGFLGGFLGSISAPYLVKRVGFGKLLIIGTALFGLNEFLLPLAPTSSLAVTSCSSTSCRSPPTVSKRFPTGSLAG
jgi:MFS family permease